jgi:predicted 3-demethylubiquinone-9 3-methyltransferase (glyoxalase superfamily)
MPKDSLLTIDFELAGQAFMGLNGGPIFKFTPATSFFVNCETEEEIDKLRAKLSEGGQVMMPFDKYPFAEKFGWTSDRFGLSWQLMLSPTPAKHKITSFLMFVGDNAGKADEAMKFYTTLFKNSEIEMTARYEEGDRDKVGLVKHGKFSLDGSPFAILESTLNHQFNFTEAVSYIVNCADQQEVDYFWDKLLEGGEASQC